MALFGSDFPRGDNIIVDKNSNIFVGGVKYERTPGLWTIEE